MVKRRLVLYVGWIIACVIIFFILRRVAQQWSDISSYEWTVNWVPALCSILILVFGFISVAIIWILLVRHVGEPLRFGDGMKIYFYSTLGRYLPGKVWQVAGIVALGKYKGRSGVRMGAGMLYLMFLNLEAGALISLAGAFFSRVGQHLTHQWKILAACMLVLLILTFIPRITVFIIKLMKLILKRDIPDIEIKPVPLLMLFILVILHWLIESFGYMLFINSFYHLPFSSFFDLSVIVAFSTMVGFLAVFVPAGLGVRDGIMIMLLPVLMPEAVAIATAVGSRFWFTITDVLTVALVLCTLLVLKRLRRAQVSCED